MATSILDKEHIIVNLLDSRDPLSIITHLSVITAESYIKIYYVCH